MMKALITFAAAVAVFGGISSASAQNTAPTTKSAISPSSINEGYKTSVPSGSEARSAVINSPTHVAGTGKFCKPRSVNGPLNCFYMTMKACEQHNKSNLYAASQIRMRERSSHDIGPKGTINSTDLVTASAIASAARRYWLQWSAPESRVRNLAAESFKE